jgi:hypothetical protein
VVSVSLVVVFGERAVAVESLAEGGRIAKFRENARRSPRRNFLGERRV